MTKYNSPVPTKCWESYLTAQGCSYARQASSHHHWKCPNCKRTLTFTEKHKEVPRFHVRTCLRTLKHTMKQFNDWAEINC